MVRIRKTQLMEESQAAKRDFVEGSEKFRLSDLSLDELANRYFEIDTQSRLLKGAILLEARSRFKADIEFGNWIKGVELFDTYHRSQLHNLMNLARFFNQRDMDGISVTVGYEISKPGNADVADKVYQVALGKNLSVAQIKAEIAKAKGLLPERVNEGGSEPELMPPEDLETFKQVILLDIKELSLHNALAVLKDCIKEIKK